MELNYKVYGEGKPLIILHGLFGSSDNWDTLAEQFGESHQVYALDIRNHGNSPHSDEFNYQLMVEDLIEFVEKHELDKVNLVGHSMGGKMAMAFVNEYPDKVNKLVVLDIGVHKYPLHHEEKIRGMMALNLASISSRSQADKQLKSDVPHDMVRIFLLKNLFWNDDKMLEWKFNLHSLAKNLENIFDKVDLDKVFNEPALFIKGGQSDYIDLNQMNLIEEHFSNHSVIVFDKSGHWLHVQEPNRLLETVNKFIQEDLTHLAS
ncbi:MAG: alpha/beta fold hydrolase [Bacteroidetes bacterium]|nr:alpha/beta fold hydrolase [Bacteroidota bacterium]